MVKIAMADNCSLKFTKDIKEHWEKKGHEVRYESGASEILAQWADIYYIDWWDNNIHYLWNIYRGENPEHPSGPTYKKPRFVIRAIDWDVWVRGIRSQEMVDFVDTIICIAPHIEEWLRKELDDRTGIPIQWGDKLHLIRPGINTTRFPLKTKKTDGFQIGMVLGDMWWPKNHMAGLDIFTSLVKKDPRYRLRIRGQHEPGQYWPVMYDQYLKSRGIADKVTLESYYLDMNDFYENIDILLHPGMKEAYCYAVGEAMSKGIPAIINEFYGSRNIWRNDYLYQTHRDAIEIIDSVRGQMTEAVSIDLRKYIKDNHNVETMLKRIDEILGI